MMILKKSQRKYPSGYIDECYTVPFPTLQPVQLFDLNFDLGRPSDAFLSLRNPNGRVAVLTGRSDRLADTRVAAHTASGVTALDVVVQNTLRNTSGFFVEAAAYVGEGALTTAPTTTTGEPVTESGQQV